MEYVIFILININLYIVLAISLNLIMGFAGLISVCHAAFMGIGAYVTTILMVTFGWPFWTTLPIAIAIAAIISALIAIPSLRIKGDHYIVMSFGVQFILTSLLNNLEITNRANGFAGIPKPDLFGIIFQSNVSCLLASFIFMIICVVFAARLVNAPFGLIIKAMREDEAATESVGINVVFYKVSVFVIGCSLAAVTGSFFASIVSFIDPFSFTLDESIFIACLAIVGGAGSIKGSLVGVPLLIAFPEILRFMNMPSSISSPLRLIFYGLLIILFMRFRPQGIFSEFRAR
jgi:branched-chain amino acid transport system permease protein